MRKKVIVINAIVIFLFAVPTILFRYSHFKCQAGHLSGGDSKTWIAKGDSYKAASSQSISLCKKNSERPERCDVLNCKNFFF